MGILRKTALLFVVFATVSMPLFTQTAQKVENLLNEPAINWGAAAAFALEAADVGVFSSQDDAFRYAMERNWLPKNAASGSKAALNGVSLLLMEAFELKGGFFYSMTRNSHYAYRELVYKDIIQGRADPEMAVSGEEFLYIINRILSIKEMETETAGLAQRQEEEEQLAKEINTQLEAHKVADTTARVTTEGVTIRLSNIQFMANSAELTESEKTKLREIARILEGIPERRILVAGHTAMANTREEQQQTSMERARAVADYLISLGVRTAAEITVQGYGAERPIATNSTEAGMAQNRRVEITILSSDGAERRGQ